MLTRPIPWILSLFDKFFRVLEENNLTFITTKIIGLITVCNLEFRLSLVYMGDANIINCHITISFRCARIDIIPDLYSPVAVRERLTFSLLYKEYA